MPKRRYLFICALSLQCGVPVVKTKTIIAFPNRFATLAIPAFQPNEGVQEIN
jgi:hypothetical protein